LLACERVDENLAVRITERLDSFFCRDRALEQLFDPLPVTSQEDGSIARRIDWLAAIDTQLVIDRGSDVFGQIGTIGNIAPISICPANDLATRYARARECV
jgi:hypothetical protein